ncbi:MAG: hypothetical protein NTY68_01180 [Candidatus Micrarchaeota archaeon]|nr:hypothetical protein [Candidatus Micrarchaeota archaeon]
MNLLNMNDSRLGAIKEKYGSTAATFWDASNIFERVIIISLAIVLAIMLTGIIAIQIGLNADDNIRLMLGISVLISALFAVIFFFCLCFYYFAVLLLSIFMKDYKWTIIIFIFGLPIIYFLYVILTKTLNSDLFIYLILCLPIFLFKHLKKI